MESTNRKIFKFFIPTVFLFWVFSMSCGQQPSGTPSSDSMERDKKTYEAGVKFLEQLKSAIRNGDKKKIASWVDLPMELDTKPSVKIKTKKDFVKYYDKIFSKKVVKSILGQDDKNLFFSSNGFMTGAGEIWFTEFDKMGFRIFKIITCKSNGYEITTD